MMEKRLAYTILETEHDEKGYIPCIVTEGESGYTRTDWHWGHDRAEARKIADEFNNRLGLSQKDVARLVLGSMRKEQPEAQTVDLIASGYEWTCPACGRENKEIEATEHVTCQECSKTFEANLPEHAYE